MKPSNTGIDWGKRRSMWAEGFGHHHKIADASIHAIAEWAIAEYRKEAKAEWQRELAAKVEDAFCELKQALAEQGSIDAFDLACVENALVDSLLNENDDHAE